MKVEVYKDKKGEHRWRIKSSNGRILCVSSEGYKRRSGAINCLRKVCNFFHCDMEKIRRHNA